MRIINPKTLSLKFRSLSQVCGVAIAVLVFGLWLLCPAVLSAQGEITFEKVGQFGGWISSLAVPETGDYAYLGEGMGFIVVDVSNPGQIRQAASLPFIGSPVGGIAFAGSTAYVVNGNGLQIVDISDPLHPALIGSCDTPGNARGIDVADTIACVADGSNGELQIIDISNPAVPNLINSINISGTVQGVKVKDGIAYVADQWVGRMEMGGLSSSMWLIQPVPPSLAPILHPVTHTMWK
jgi:hypothetical protein